MAHALGTLIDTLRLLSDFARGYDPTYNARYPETQTLAIVLSGLRDTLRSLLLS